MFPFQSYRIWGSGLVRELSHKKSLAEMTPPFISTDRVVCRLKPSLTNGPHSGYGQMLDSPPKTINILHSPGVKMLQEGLPQG